MLHDEACERHGKVIAETLLADLQREFPAVIAVTLDVVLSVVYARKGISGVEYPEEKLVSFLSVLAQQGAEVFRCGRLYLRIAECLEHRTYGVEYVIAACHFRRSEVPCALRYGRFLCHLIVCFLFSLGRKVIIRVFSDMSLSRRPTMA